MENKISRLNFMKVSVTSLFIPAISFPEIIKSGTTPALKAELVNEFVKISHTDIDKTKSMLESEPALLNASRDWGGGDFETALEAAGHMGRKDIADLLFAKGARLNIFCAAMLGKLEMVKTTLTAFPDLKTSKGPHGLQLLHHARKGGEDAKEVLDYLVSIGAK